MVIEKQIHPGKARDLVTNYEFSQLIPPLTEEEYEQLKSSLLADGCHDPLLVWDNIIIDGHHRHQICTENNLPYDIRKCTFNNNDEAKEWMIRHQFGRRNLSLMHRAELALKLKPLIEAKAKERQRVSNGKVLQNSANLKAEPIHTRNELAILAGVSRDTIDKAEQILERAVPEVQQMALTKKISVNVAAKVAKLPKDEQHTAAKAGPAAVKVAAKKATAEPKKNADTLPWFELEQGIKEVQKLLYAASRRLAVVLECDCKTKHICNKWAKFFSPTTIREINTIARGLHNNLPGAVDEKPPGYVPIRSVKTHDAVTKGEWN